MTENQRTRNRIIEGIRAPLGFYVLALLIVEAFLVASIFKGTLQPDHQFSAIKYGVWMFVLVVLIVTLLVYARPENLIFDQSAHLERSKADYGTDLETVDRNATKPSETDKTNGS